MLDIHDILEIEQALIDALPAIKKANTKAIRNAAPRRDCKVSCHNRRDCIGTLRVNLKVLESQLAFIKTALAQDGE